MHKFLVLIEKSSLKYKKEPRTNNFQYWHTVSKEVLEEYLGKKIGEKSPMPPSNKELDVKIQTLDRKVETFNVSVGKIEQLILNLQKSMDANFERVNSRLDNLEKDMSILKSLPTIKKELKKMVIIPYI